jgi:hypothetical protein
MNRPSFSFQPKQAGRLYLYVNDAINALGLPVDIGTGERSRAWNAYYLNNSGRARVTLMLDAGEQPGWAARMMSHVSLKMIRERFYSYIKNYQRDDGAAFMNNVYDPNATPGDEAGGDEAGDGGQLGTA